MYKTTNSGTTWELKDAHYSSDISDFVSEHVGYRMSEEGVLFKTIDSANTWVEIGATPCSGPDIPNVCSYDKQIKFVSENIGYAISYVNGNGVIYKTIDSGEAWISVSYIDVDQIFISLDLINESNGYIFMITFPGNNGTLRKTTNSGETWTTQSSNFSSNIFSSFRMDFINQ